MHFSADKERLKRWGRSRVCPSAQRHTHTDSSYRKKRRKRKVSGGGVGDEKGPEENEQEGKRRYLKKTNERETQMDERENSKTEK